MADSKAVIFNDGKFQGVGNSGQVVPYGKLYFYEAASGNQVDTFTTSTMETKNSFPIILSASGKADVFVTEGTFDIALKDKNDVTVWTINNFVAAGGDGGIAPIYTSVNREDITGIVGSSIILAETPTTGVNIHKNGLLLNKDEYTLDSKTIVFATPLIITDDIVAEYGFVALGTNESLLYGIETMADLLDADVSFMVAANVKGYYVKNDGGGGIFNYDATIDKSTADGGMIIDPGQTLLNQGNGIGSGCWKRQYDNEVSVLWFGAKGDGATDDTAVFTAVAAISDTAIVPKTADSYLISSSLVNAGTTFLFYGDSGQVTGTATVSQLKAIFTDNGYINGIPIADDLREGKIEIISGTLRQNSVTRTQWDWIKDSLHEPIGVDDSTPAIALGEGLTINFNKTYSKALSMVVSPDETLASFLGMTMGAKVQLSSMQLQASVNLTLSAHIKHNGATWDVAYGEGQGGGDHESVVNTITSSSSSVTINHDWIPGDAIQLTPHTNNGAVVPSIPCIKTNTDIQTVLNFVDYAGAFVTAPAASMSFNFTKSFRGRIYLDGNSASSTPSGDVLDLDLGNIWFYGIMQV